MSSASRGWKPPISPDELLGNDVVWLEDPANQGRSADRRLLERILTPRERLLVAVAPVPDTLLWSLWAAKEAAYKAWSRNHPGPFAPQRWSVDFDTQGGRALVYAGGPGIPIRWTHGPGWVHALAGDDTGVVVGVDRLDGDASAAVRALATRVLKTEGGPVAAVDGVPPWFWIEGRRGPPVSLSHDGPWGAVAFRWPPSSLQNS